jgi:hypothetical protein
MHSLLVIFTVHAGPDNKQIYFVLKATSYAEVKLMKSAFYLWTKMFSIYKDVNF